MNFIDFPVNKLPFHIFDRILKTSVVHYLKMIQFSKNKQNDPSEKETFVPFKLKFDSSTVPYGRLLKFGWFLLVGKKNGDWVMYRATFSKFIMHNVVFLNVIFLSARDPADGAWKIPIIIDWNLIFGMWWLLSDFWFLN